MSRTMFTYKTERLIEFLEENKTVRLGDKEYPKYSYVVTSNPDYIEITFDGFAHQYDSVNCAFLMGQEFKAWQDEKESTDGMKAVLIRSYAAGVHFGYLKSKEDTLSGRVVVLIKTRRVWYWDGAASLSQMAAEGVSKPENCKFSMEIESNEIINVIEILPLTEKALLNLLNVPVWKA